MSKRNDSSFETAEAKEIRSVIDQYCGVFKFSCNVKLYCIFCKLELDNHKEEYVQQHLNSDDHIRNFMDKHTIPDRKGLYSKWQKDNYKQKTKNSRCLALVTSELILVSDDEDESDPEMNKVDLVINAFKEGIYANRKFDKINCTVCNADIRDSFLLLKKHLNDKIHIKNKKKNSKEKLKSTFSKRIMEFVEQNSSLEWDGQLVHCKICKKVIQAKHFNLVRHCSRPFHQAALMGSNSPENVFSRQARLERKKLEKLIKDNSGCLLFHNDKVLCQPCKKIITPKCRNVIKHLDRGAHKDKMSKFDPSSLTSAEMDLAATQNGHQSTSIISGRIFQHLVQKEQNKLDRLVNNHHYLMYYNQSENVLCKPCKRIMLAKYVNVNNHLRRQCHKDKLLLYQQEREELTTAIEQISEKSDSRWGNSHHQQQLQQQVLIIEQVPLAVDLPTHLATQTDEHVSNTKLDDSFVQMNIEI